MTTVLLDVARSALGWLFLAYTLVAVSHYLIQLFYAHRTYRRQASPAYALEYPDLAIDVDILIPSYNEEPELLEACVRSALRQDHPGRLKVIVIDDGSPNRDLLDPVYDRLARAGATIIRAPKNVGKRHAQALGFPACEGEIIVTLDSDSILRRDAVRRLTRRFRDPRVGAATGFVDVVNDRKNLLTRLQRLRYWMAFNQERAAQTWFNTVMCCSGPLAAYRREIVNLVRDAYLTQTYGGVKCTYGDDRHLTNLVLAVGYDTVFDGGAVALTHVPETFRQFVRQQLRWSKSFYRELVWTVPYIGERRWYPRFDVACQVAMPLILPFTASTALVLGILDSPTYVIRYLALIAVVGAIRATYGAVRHRNVRFYLFALYGFVSAFVLMPIRFRALWTLTDARWGTRGPVLPKVDPWSPVAAFRLRRGAHLGPSDVGSIGRRGDQSGDALMPRSPITRSRPWTPTSGAFAGETFTSERQYRNALARQRGFPSWYAQQQAPAPEVRGRRDFRRLRPAEQIAYEKTGSVLTRMRQGMSLSRAARLEHTTPAAVKRHAGDALVSSRRGTYLVTTTDRLFRRLSFVTHDGVTIVETRDSRVASLVAEYDAAIQLFLASGDASGLSRFEGRVLRAGGKRYPLVTDINTLEALGRRGEINSESMYAAAA